MIARFLAAGLLGLLALPLGAAGAPAHRPCGTFRATSFTGAKTHVKVTVYQGPTRCRQARHVLRYAITHRERRGNTLVGSPPGWNCANGGPGIVPLAAGYSCEANNPRRIVTGLFLLD